MENRDLYIVSPDSERHRYVCDFIFGQIMGLNYEIVDVNYKLSSDARVIIYGIDGQFPGAFSIPASGLLDEKTVSDRIVSQIGKGSTLKLFVSGHPGYDLDFDLFSMVFYCLTRYEEYRVAEFDQHGRYIHTQSLLFDAHEDFIHPVLDYRIGELADLLMKKWGIKVCFPSFKAVMSVDIDIAWTIRCKGLLRTTGAILRALTKGRLAELKQRINVLTGRSRDPFDTYDKIKELSRANGLPLHYFFLLSGHKNKYDRNSRRNCSQFGKLIRKLSAESETGLHYSYRSFENQKALEDEFRFLSRFSTVNSGRAHFLRCRFPDTFRRWAEIGIKHDYSLGYAGIAGFRAGTAHDFLFFDLEKNKVSFLTLHPVSLMDGTLVDYRGSTPLEAEDLLKRIVESMQPCGGTFYLLLHNETLSLTGRWKIWNDFFERIVVILGSKSTRDQVSET